MNRKQRRQKDSNTSKIEIADDIPLARPSETQQRKAKTLYELAAERQASLTKDGSNVPILTDQTVVNVAIGPDGEIRTLDGGALPDQSEVDDLPPWIDTLMFSSSLASLHFTLNALTYYQYAETLPWKRVFWETILQALPVLFLLVHFMHGHIATIRLNGKLAQGAEIIKQLTYIGIANVAGCYLIRMVNDGGYMAVMKNAPSIGTLWVWTVVEMGLVGSLAGVIGPGIFAWYNGYGVY